MRKNVDFLIVGAGFAGAVLAERIASQLGRSCLVVDRRTHIGGNAYDFYDRAGILIHAHGPHYFRTNSDRIVNYLSQFTDWHFVDYKILSWTHGRFWQFPINLNTFEQLIGRSSSTEEMEKTLEAWKFPIFNPRNSEEVITSQVGQRLYEMFFKNYTKKQWQKDPRELDASVCGRIPIRTNRDNRYFSDQFQALPRKGYTQMFQKILSHKNIEVVLNCDFKKIRNSVTYKHLIYTGQIDEFFNYSLGPLPYRSLRFEHETFSQEFFQPAVQVNYPNDFDFTRIVELKHATGQQSPLTSIVREFPENHQIGKEPYYPIPSPSSKDKYQEYFLLSKKLGNVSFVGRLATYRYYNMDQVIGMALAEFDRLKKIFCRASDRKLL